MHKHLCVVIDEMGNLTNVKDIADSEWLRLNER